MRLLGRPSRFPRPLAVLPVVLLTMLLAAGCGDDGEGVQANPDPDAGDGDGQTLEPRTVEILSAVATGGSTEDGAFQLDGPESREGIAQLTRELTRPGLELEVRQVVRETEVPDGMSLVGAVVSIGCDVPSDIKVAGGDEEPIQLEPVWTGVKRLPECFAPVTSIGIVLVDRRLVEFPL